MPRSRSCLLLAALTLSGACSKAVSTESDAEPTPAAEPLAGAGEPEPAPVELVCRHMIELLERDPTPGQDLEQARATCLEQAALTLAEDRPRYLADSYCSLLSSSASELARCTEDPRSVPCMRAADRMGVLYYQQLDPNADEEARANQAAIEHDRLLFACLAEGFDYGPLDCVLAATSYEALRPCNWAQLEPPT